MTETATERFERLAGDFHRDTGLTAPGKDVAAAMGDTRSYQERYDRWVAWLRERGREARV